MNARRVPRKGSCRVLLDSEHSSHSLWTVMDIFRTQLYRLNIVTLSVLGLWPYQKLKSWQLFQQIMCQITVITVISAQGVKLFEIWGDLDIMIECLTPMGVQVIASVKATNCLVYQKQMKKLLETMQRDWSELRDEKESKILMKHIQAGRSINAIYAGFLFGSLVIYLLIPLLPRFLDIVVPLNESRPPAYLYHTQYYVDPEEYFLWILLHTYSGTCIAVTTIVAADTMFISYIMHVCGILAVIGDRLENLTPKDRATSKGDVDVLSKDDNDRCNREIVLCIEQHYKVTEIVNLIEASYSISYLLVLGLSVVLLSISAVQMLIKLGEVSEMIRMFQFNASQCNHLFFNSWPCQKLIDQAGHFRESLYAVKWYLLSERNKHLIRFTMLRTIEPQKVTAGKLYVMSMENFCSVIQASISYFTVFASIR